MKPGEIEGVVSTLAVYPSNARPDTRICPECSARQRAEMPNWYLIVFVGETPKMESIS